MATLPPGRSKKKLSAIRLLPFPFHRLTVYDLFELLHDIGIAVGHGIGQQIVHSYPKAVDEPHKGILTPCASVSEPT